MGPDGVSDVTDVDGVQVLVVTGLLNKDLLESKSCIGRSDGSMATVKMNMGVVRLTWLLRL